MHHNLTCRIWTKAPTMMICKYMLSISTIYFFLIWHEIYHFIGSKNVFKETVKVVDVFVRQKNLQTKRFRL